MAEILLGCEEFSPDKPDNCGRTPLALAVVGMLLEVVKMLLEREEVNLDKPDNHRRAPLSIATKRGSKRVLALLLVQSRKVVTTI